MDFVLLIASFAVILAGALLFTNAVEWIGHRLDLGEGAVGSLLAAVGTAMPETLIAIVALIEGSKSEDVAIGAIVGAPFLLATLAMGLVGYKGKASYAAAKGGVIQLTKSAALDYATAGIRVNAICPGMTWTGLAHGGREGPPPDQAVPQPMRRWGLPEELAAAALFFASDESSFVTGTALPVDGGYVAR